MQYLNHVLKKHLKEHGNINVAIFGIGFMGKSLVSQLEMIDGINVFFAFSRNCDDCVDAFIKSKIEKERLKKFKSSVDLKNKYYTDDFDIIFSKEFIDVCDVVIDSTGDPYFGADLAKKCLDFNLDLITFNLEMDSVIGGFLSYEFNKKGVMYTGISGDEPGTIKELYDFATLLGFEVTMVGKGKNNKLDTDADYESVSSLAKEKGISPKMLASFVDGSKTMIELTTISNAIGYKIQKDGGFGYESSIENLENILQPKEFGGLIEKEYSVEWINGIAPGVFILIKTDNEIIDHELKFLKLGKGPYFILYRPYHLTSIEVPVTIIQSHLLRIPTIQSKELALTSDCVCVAKKDLKAGDYLDFSGGKTAYGMVVDGEKSINNSFLPFGFVKSNVKIIKDIKKGEFIKFSDCEIPDSQLLKYRKTFEKHLTF